MVIVLCVSVRVWWSYPVAAAPEVIVRTPALNRADSYPPFRVRAVHVKGLEDGRHEAGRHWGANDPVEGEAVGAEEDPRGEVIKIFQEWNHAD